MHLPRCRRCNASQQTHLHVQPSGRVYKQRLMVMERVVSNEMTAQNFALTCDIVIRHTSLTANTELPLSSQSPSDLTNCCRLPSLASSSDTAPVMSALGLRCRQVTMAVGGTPEKCWWSSKNAATSRTAPSPGLMPLRRPLPRSSALLPPPFGLLMAKGSSSSGLKTATLVPSSSQMK